MKRNWKVLIFMFLFYVGLKAQDNYSLKGYVKGMASLQFANNSNSFSQNSIHNRIDFNWYASQNLTVTTGLRNRFTFGSLIPKISGYANFLSKDLGYLNLSKVWLNKNSSIGISQLDRLFVDYSVGKFEISVGRQRINWGQAFVWNPNDLFNSYSYFDFDYEEKPGSDAVRTQYYLTETSKIEWTTSINRNKKITSAFMYKWNMKGYDFQVLSGIYSQNDWVFGTGWSGSIFGGGFNGEITYFNSINSVEKSNQITAVLHYDYTFKNSLSLQLESLYNGFAPNTATNSIASFTLMSATPKNLFPSKVAIFGSVSYNLSPLITSSFSGIIGNSGKFLYVAPMLTYSISNNKELAVIGQLYQLKSDNSLVKTTHGGIVFARLKWSF